MSSYTSIQLGLRMLVVGVVIGVEAVLRAEEMTLSIFINGYMGTGIATVRSAATRVTATLVTRSEYP